MPRLGPTSLGRFIHRGRRRQHRWSWRQWHIGLKVGHPTLNGGRLFNSCALLLVCGAYDRRRWRGGGRRTRARLNRRSFGWIGLPRSKLQTQPGPDQVRVCKDGALLAQLPNADIQCKEVLVAVRVAKEPGCDAAQRVTWLDHVEALAIAFLDRAARQGYFEDCVWVDHPRGRECAVTRHGAADVRVDDSLELLTGAVVALGDSPQRFAAL